VLVSPNSDAGSHSLTSRAASLIDERAKTGKPTRLFVNLDAITYWSLLAQVRALVGNSSSGIMEAASFALPAVNIGIRQQGRERARNILDVAADADAIEAAIHRALSDEFAVGLIGMANPYGTGHASERIAQVLATVRLDGLLIKAPAPIPPTAGEVA